MDKGHYYRREILSVGASTLCTSPLVAHLPSCLQERSEKTPGTILICGGGKLPDSILDRFCEISDSKNSTLVLIPTASARSDSGDYSPWLELWKSRGWQDVLVVHSSDNRTTKDPKFAEQIDQAQAVWITGGDQSRLSERFSGTVLIERLNHLLQRGGVLGGTSAGAAILSKTMGEERLKQVAEVIAAKRVSLTIEEARDLAKRAVRFKAEKGRLPSLTAMDPWEKRMAEGVAYLQRKAKEDRSE